MVIRFCRVKVKTSSYNVRQFKWTYMILLTIESENTWLKYKSVSIARLYFTFSFFFWLSAFLCSFILFSHFLKAFSEKKNHCSRFTNWTDEYKWEIFASSLIRVPWLKVFQKQLNVSRIYFFNDFRNLGHHRIVTKSRVKISKVRILRSVTVGVRNSTAFYPVCGVKKLSNNAC